MTTSKRIDVAIVEDNEDVRRGLELLIGGTPRFACVGSFGDAESAIQEISNLQPDVLLLDIELPGMSGIESIPHLNAAAPDTDILMLTVHAEEEQIFSSLCAGACGYLLKTIRPSKLLDAIVEINNGGAPMSAQIARRVTASFRRSPATELTTRESEILALLCDGLSYKMIADNIGISKGTVHCHIKKIYKKLHVNSNSQAVAEALRQKLV